MSSTTLINAELEAALLRWLDAGRPGSPGEPVEDSDGGEILAGFIE